jgi:hypothetical protein
MVALFFFGFVASSTQPTRVLEALCIALYPIASQTLYSLQNTTSKKKYYILLIILIVVTLLTFYRYNTQIQRRVVA